VAIVVKSDKSEGFRELGSDPWATPPDDPNMGQRRRPEWYPPVGVLLLNGDLQAIPRISEKKLEPPQLTKEKL
jgi:hypothetical protein